MRDATKRALEPVMLEGRVPPHDLDAEAAVLSAVMLDEMAADKVLDILKPEHFYSEAHRRIYEAAVDLKTQSRPVDVVQIGTWLKNHERISQVGGMSYLTEILNAAPAIANVRAYAETIFEKWRVRQVIATCQRVASEGYVDYGEAKDFALGAAGALQDIANEGTVASMARLRDVMHASFKSLNERVARGVDVGNPTGFTRYDRMTGGLHDGDLTIIAARPGMGKTSLVLNMAANTALPRPRESGGEKWEESGSGVVIFSLEMPKDQLANRMICSEGKVDVSKVRTGMLSPADWGKLTAAGQFLGALDIWIDDSPAITMVELRAKVRRLQSEFDRPEIVDDKTGEVTQKQQRLGVAVVDYLQLMKGCEGVRSREQEISEISRGLKALAKECKLAVIALSQLNRAVETRGDKKKRPQLSDLRESGAIEQDADNICFIYRDDYYNEDSEEKNIAELIVAKQRNGATGTTKVRWDREYTRFDNLADGDCVDE